jgi:hypothetical protein
VAFIRAWAYMQLVQNYGRVPFIVKPVDKADTGWETNPEDWATPDNLLDLLLAKGNIERAYEFEKQYGFPQYGAISPAGSTGGVSISQQKMLFPGDIVMGELYLMRGASKSDFEKALVLESYFEDNDFEYSLDYVPPDDSIEYFVFESKKGYCASYATAMTLMARAVDLPARYVEGFSAYEMTDTGAFLVRDGHAHAFVEVYIPGAGWLTFDPTVPSYKVMPQEEEDSSNFLYDLLNEIVKRFWVIIITAIIICNLLPSDF